MRLPRVLESDPVTDGEAGVEHAIESLTVNRLFLQGTDQPLNHPCRRMSARVIAQIREMVVELDEESTNQLFQSLSDWETQLQDCEFDFEEMDL